MLYSGFDRELVDPDAPVSFILDSEYGAIGVAEDEVNPKKGSAKVFIVVRCANRQRYFGELHQEFAVCRIWVTGKNSNFRVLWKAR